MKKSVVIGMVTCVMAFAPAWASGDLARNSARTQVIDLRQLPRLSQIVTALAERQLVFVGETHDQYSHHLNQLEVIRGLHEIHPQLVVAIEFLPRQVQPALDDYVQGRIDEGEMLRRTAYFTHWGFDYRLYRPIFQYASANRLPILALNYPRSLTSKVARKGLQGLSEEERAALPQMDGADTRYRERLAAIYQRHPHAGDSEAAFENFLNAQLLWDEGMAERIAEFLREHPERHMVVLAGNGHLVYGMGIPDRVKKRVGVTSAIVLNDPQEGLASDMADFLLLPGEVTLPPKGMLGIILEEGGVGALVNGFAEGSAGEVAGLQKGDRIVGIDGQSIRTPEDVQIALLDRAPGDVVELSVSREIWIAGEKVTTLRARLQ